MEALAPKGLTTKKKLCKFARCIKILHQHGWKGTDIARVTGYTQPAVSSYKTGQAAPGYDFLRKLHVAVGCNAHWLLTGEGEPFAPEQANPANPVIDNLDIVRRQVAALVEQAKSVAPECSTPCDSADKGIKMGTNMDPGAAESPVKNGSSSDQITV